MWIQWRRRFAPARAHQAITPVDEPGEPGVRASSVEPGDVVAGLVVGALCVVTGHPTGRIVSVEHPERTVYRVPVADRLEPVEVSDWQRVRVVGHVDLGLA